MSPNLETLGVWGGQLFCSKCGDGVQENWMHCPNCGNSIKSNLKSNKSLKVPVDKAFSGMYEEKLSSKKKSKIGCGTLILIFFLIAFLGGVVSNISRSLSDLSADDVNQSRQAKTPITLEEALVKYGEESLDSLAKENCEVLELLDYETSLKDLSDLDALKEIVDARKAADFIVSDLPTQSYLEKFEGPMLNKIATLLAPFEEKVDFNTYVKSGGNWREVLKDKIIGSCPTQDNYSKTISALEEMDQEAQRIRTLAARAPWFPAGFTEYVDGLTAWKWVDRSCSYSTASCNHIDVVAASGCNNLYVEVNYLDSSGSVVDWSNDTANNLGPGQTAKLEFVTFEDQASSATLSEISCY